MKRHEALVQLSRDHHFTLLACFKIRQGISKNVEPFRMEDYLKSFYQQHLEDHFTEEEEYVFPLLGDGHPLIEEAKSQHRIIKNSVENGLDTYENLSEFANILEKHVRLEERQIFQEIQGKVPEEKLNELLKIKFAVHKEMPWTDEFWK